MGARMDGEIVATPLMNIGQPFGATWTGMPGEPGDWVGLYSVGAPDTNPWLWIHGEDDAYTWLLPGVFPAGDYEFRMFDDYSFERIGTSNVVHIQDPSQPFTMVDDAPIAIEVRATVQDYSGATWTPGPTINGLNYSGPHGSFVGTLNFVAGADVDYVTTPVLGALPYGGSLKMTFELQGGPLIGSTGSHSSGLFLYIEPANNNWSGEGRIWSAQPVFLSGVESGTFTLEVLLTPEHWSGVLGDEPDFAGTLANAAKIGFTFLDDQSKGHGNKDMDGNATLRVADFKVLSP
jgi:hypothetical protein